MKKNLLIFLGLTLILAHKSSVAQTSFYDVNTIKEIRLYFDIPNWDHVLDSMYSEGNGDRILATVILDGTQLDSVGVRYKGFSSASTDRIKNPFNIKLDYVINQNYNNIEKIKLSNVIQDPSFVREVLSYEIARKYMPASLANYANLFINDSLWGVYTNVESVNKEFLQKHFGSSESTFVKGNPESLDLFGENANLGDSPGTDSSSYYPLYDMQSDFGWADLYNFIDTLNNFSDSIENVLNVDMTLWMHAFNYSVINFDSYVGYAQNYYLYKDHHGRFNPILWDLNMSFGSFRLADASLHFSGFNITEAKEMDPLLHYNNVSVYPRPLMRNLFNNGKYRRMYLAHMRTIMEENFDNQNFMSRASFMQTLIDSDVDADPNKFYSYDDFKDNLTITVSDFVDYPGISDLMDDRAVYLSTYPGFHGAPEISSIAVSSSNVTIGDSLFVTVQADGATEVILAYRYSSNDLFTKVSMLDDGNNNDGVAGDSLYGFLLKDIGYTVEYYIYAENSLAGRFMPARAAYEYYELAVNKKVVLNELCATNVDIWADDQGQFEDWIELYNNSNVEMDLNGYYLSDDNLNLTKWSFPDTSIAANGYLIIWCDKDVFDSGIHANFKLSAVGESVFFSDSSGTQIDQVSYETQTVGNTTFGRLPNGTGSWNYLNSSFNSVNSSQSTSTEGYVNNLHSNEFIIYPNPSSGIFNIETNSNLDSEITIRDINGRTILTKSISKENSFSKFDLTNITRGFYFITLKNSEQTTTRKIIIK